MKITAAQRPDEARWHTLPLMDQMANVGSEVERTITARETGRPGRFDAALHRALDLFDVTASDPRWGVDRLREILRAREEFCRLFFDETVAPDSADGLRRYFLAFAAAARRGR